MVVPCYRCADTIERTVESILSQTALPGEILLVEDCSPDATRAFLRARVPEWNRRCPTRLIEARSNGGPSAARNLGMEKSAGTWIAFLDADDLWLPSKLEAQCRAATEHQASFLTHWIYRVRNGVIPESGTNGPASVEWLQYAQEYLKNRVVTSSALFRRTTTRFDRNLSFCEDHDFWLRYMKESGQPVLVLCQRLSVKNLHDIGLSSRLTSMFRAQLSNIVRHRPTGLSGLLLCVVAVTGSTLAFVRRLAVRQIDNIRRRQTTALSALC